jgi:hypothetical protein
MTKSEETRIRNPFHDPLVTELIEDPVLYREMFSQRILVGETLAVFQPANVVLVGPQGSGKSMILNLIRYSVVSEWISGHGKPPAPLKHLAPFFGISVNLVRADFHAFGRRSVFRSAGGGLTEEARDASCAADFLGHYLFREFLKGLQLLLSNEGSRLREWLGVDSKRLENQVRTIGKWDCWFGYYRRSTSLQALMTRCEKRLNVWRSFLNTNIDDIPRYVWETKSTLSDPLHAMGNFLQSVGPSKGRLPFFVVIDQYEVLPELNPSYGTTLQRIVNTLIKARDPVVFYKIGARTYDWGTELRIWGAESRIEVQRDYVMINLADVLMRNEDSGGWLFPGLARDVAYRRLKVEGHYNVSKGKIEEILGTWSAAREAGLYFKVKPRKVVVLKKLSDPIRRRIVSLCGSDCSPLDLRLAGAWALQKKKRGLPESKIVKELGEFPWRRNASWRKERVAIALLQVASLANQKRRYFGWKPVINLSGANISAFLLLCSEIWDMATKVDIHPLKDCPLPYHIQTEGVFVASDTWRNRDRNEPGRGRKRYDVLNRLGPAIHDLLIGDLAISNPGHSGFSLRESDFSNDERGEKVREFLQNAVSWAIFEERPHTSKQREAATRRKWYLHPLLSPVFDIPVARVKEPLYVELDDVFAWLFERGKVSFRRNRPIPAKLVEPAETSHEQLEMCFEESE